MPGDLYYPHAGDPIDHRLIQAIVRHLLERDDYLGGDTIVRQGKLDGALSVGGTQTVSIWWNSSTHDYFNGVDADSGEDWENCCAPLTQASEVASGTAVTVIQIDTKRLIIGAACPA